MRDTVDLMGGGQARQNEARRSSYLQSGLDVGKCGFGLVEEAVDNAPAEVTVVVIVHLKDLLKCTLVDEILDIRELGRGRLDLLIEVSGKLRVRPGMLMEILTSLPAGAMFSECVGERDKPQRKVGSA